MVGMANQDSLGRSTRARNKVRTYNLKILSGTSRSSRRRSHNVDPQSARHSDPRISSEEQDNLETTESLEEHFQHHHGEDSSELTSPMMSPNLLALETSLSEEGTTVASTQSGSPVNNTGLYDCFNATLHPKGHFYSAKELFARGVWIGYLSPDRHSESFRGLPSFSTLKANFTNFSPPYPPVINGFVRGERSAVCRGCASSTSALIAFFEIQFVRTSKLVIMPLDADDDDGVFAIMLPQKVDRSLRGLQSYRPYELTNGGTGDTFVNNYMMLTLRNPDSEAGTLDTVLEVLSAQEHADAIREDVSPLFLALDNRSIGSPTSTVMEMNSGLEVPEVRFEETMVNDERAFAPKRQKTDNRTEGNYDVMEDVCQDSGDGRIQEQVAATPGPSEPAREVTKSPGFDKSVPKDNGPAQQNNNMALELSGPGPQATRAPSPAHQQNTRTLEPTVHATKAPSPMDNISRDNSPAQQQTTMISELPERATQPTQAPSPVQSISSGLTNEQAECVHLVWTIKDSGIEYEFAHKMSECKTFAGLLALLEEETEGVPTIADVLARTKTWRITFRLGDGTTKAIIVLKGTETAFSRLKTTLAQASFWTSKPYPVVDMELKPLSRSDSASATSK